MSEDTSEKISRRKFLKYLGAGVAAFTAACTGQPQTDGDSTFRQKESSADSQYRRIINEWRQKKNNNKKSKRLLDVIKTGTDLTYLGNELVEAIRKIPNKIQRFMATIGFLDVMNSPRYNRGDWACNSYAIDFLRLLLGNEVIGYRVSRYNSAPHSVGEDNLNWNSQAAIDQLNHDYIALDSNILDAWMRDHGKPEYGWKKVESQAALLTKLNAGYIALGVTKDELIQNRTKRTGHAFVLGGANGRIFLTQASDNVQLQIFSKGDTYEKVYPQASTSNFWVKILP